MKLFNSNLLVVDEAFEYLVSKSAKGEKGQYFTPRHVIDMCVQMLNPQPGEYMIDTASGSCGFPVHTIYEEDGLKTDRRQAWRNFICNNRKRELYVDNDIDISHLCDEMNDMEMELEK